jgi:hypothetical protein
MLTIRKNARESICLRMDEYQGHRYIDVRIWATSNESAEETGRLTSLAVPQFRTHMGTKRARFQDGSHPVRTPTRARATLAGHVQFRT